jgi:hypothetical protein
LKRSKNKFNRVIALGLVICLLFSLNLSTVFGDEVSGDAAQAEPQEDLLTAEEVDALVAEGAVSSYELILVMKDAVSEEVVVSDTDDVTDTIEIASDEKAVVVSTADDIGEAIEAYNEDPDVLYAQPNYIYTALDDVSEPETISPLGNTNDTNFSSQWALQTSSATRVNQAWDILPDKEEDVKVAVVDSGLKNTTGSGNAIIPEDLEDNIIAGEMQDFSSGSTSLYDITDDNSSSYGHGTHVAGIIAATAGNGIGVAGVSNNRAKVIPYKVFKSDSTSSSKLILAINEAMNDGCRVINFSLGGYGHDALLEEKIDTAYSQGIITVASAGNDGSNDKATNYMFPSDYDNVISVIATNSTGNRSYLSNYNQYKDIAAPGESIYSTVPNGYGNKTGTSMASPYICGVIALLWSSYPDLTPDEIKDILYDTATDKGDQGRDDYYGNGLVNAEAALVLAAARYDVTYHGNGDTGGAVPIDSVAYKYKGDVTVLSNDSLIKEHYLFDGWNTEAAGTGTDYAGGAIFVIRADTDLYAQWIPDPADDFWKQVTYHGNGNTNGTAPVDSNNYEENDEVTVLSENTLSKTHYLFDGWNTEAAGTGIGYSEGAVFEIEADTDLYAQWTKDPADNFWKQVTYHGNGNTDGTVPVDAKKYGENEEVTVLSENTLSKAHYLFDGWNTKANGNGMSYAVDDKFDIVANTDLYAQWTPDLDDEEYWNDIVLLSEATTAEISNETYTGAEIEPEITLTVAGEELILGQDYEVEYEDNVNAGTANVTITGIGNYTGTKFATFEILAKSISGLDIGKVKDQAYNNKVKKPALTITHNGTKLVETTHYKVKHSTRKAVGKATITITGKGNYTGTTKVSFKIVPKTATISKATAGKKQVKIAWGKVSGTTKYQVRYRVKGASSWKSKTVSATSKTLTVKSLKKGKKYEVQVRSYKTVSGAKYYSAWSKVRTSGKVK